MDCIWRVERKEGAQDDSKVSVCLSPHHFCYVIDQSVQIDDGRSA